MPENLREKIRAAWAADQRRIEQMERSVARNRALNPEPVDPLSKGMWEQAFAGVSGRGVKQAQ